MLKSCGSVRIVQIENRRLRETVSTTVAIRMQRVAFYFGGTAIIGLDHQWDSTAARRHRGGEILRHAMHIVFRHFPEGQNLLLWPPAATARQAKPAEQERGRHDFDEVPARDRVSPLTGLGREFALDPLT